MVFKPVKKSIAPEIVEEYEEPEEQEEVEEEEEEPPKKTIVKPKQPGEKQLTVDDVLNNHERRLNALEAWVFRLKELI